MKKSFNFNYALVAFCFLVILLVWISTKFQPNYDAKYKEIHQTVHPKEASMSK